MTGPYLASAKMSSLESVILLLLFQFCLISLRWSSSCLHLVSSLSIPSTFPSLFPSKTCFRWQFLCKMSTVQLPSLLFIVFWIFLSFLTLCQPSSLFTPSVQLIFILLQHHVLEIFHKNGTNSKCRGQVGSIMPSYLNPSCLSLEINYSYSFFCGFCVLRTNGAS